jgi:hypothetical protein
VIILPSVRAGRQIALFEEAVRFISERPEPINQLVEIDTSGRITVRPWPDTPAPRT